ncbi:hypothetical protein OH77DRAFT_988094 [Trametes cingulata]|nr:hypothetical protein OH77DRAFT_988094 [Trametes cingulata]
MAYDYYRSSVPGWGTSQFQFTAPPVPGFRPQPTWGGLDFYNAHAVNADPTLYNSVMSRVGQVGPLTLGRREARYWHRRVYGGLSPLTQLLPIDIGAAAAYEAYRTWKHNPALYEPLGADPVRMREGLVGMAIAETTRLWQYSGRPTDAYGLRAASEAAASVSTILAERLLEMTGGDAVEQPPITRDYAYRARSNSLNIPSVIRAGGGSTLGAGAGGIPAGPPTMNPLSGAASPLPTATAGVAGLGVPGGVPGAGMPPSPIPPSTMPPSPIPPSPVTPSSLAGGVAGGAMPGGAIAGGATAGGAAVPPGPMPVPAASLGARMPPGGAPMAPGATGPMGVGAMPPGGAYGAGGLGGGMPGAGMPGAGMPGAGMPGAGGYGMGMPAAGSGMGGGVPAVPPGSTVIIESSGRRPRARRYSDSYTDVPRRRRSRSRIEIVQPQPGYAAGGAYGASGMYGSAGAATGAGGGYGGGAGPYPYPAGAGGAYGGAMGGGYGGGMQNGYGGMPGAYGGAGMGAGGMGMGGMPMPGSAASAYGVAAGPGGAPGPTGAAKAEAAEDQAEEEEAVEEEGGGRGFGGLARHFRAGMGAGLNATGFGGGKGY